MGLQLPHFTPQRAKELRVLGLVEARGATTRRALAAATGMHAASLNRLVAGLIDRGVLTALEPDATGRRGRPSDRLAIDPAAGAVVGLEFGRDHLVGVVLDAIGALVHVVDGLTPPPFEGGSGTTGALAEAAMRCVDEAGIESGCLRAVGLALHDVVTADGHWHIRERAQQPPVDVRGALESSLGVRTLVEDVSRAFAIAEHGFGAGVGESDMIYVFIGSHGVGGGLFVNDRLLVSSSGHCGEIGHLVIDEDGALCQCGSVGCFETVASHRAVEDRFASLVDRGVATWLARGARFADICAAAEAGDKAAYLVLRDLADAMGRALAPAVNLIGAPAIVVGGALARAGDSFLRQVETTLRPRVVPGLAPRLALRYASLPPHAGAWGAATLARATALAEGAYLDAAVPRVREEAASATP